MKTPLEFTEVIKKNDLTSIKQVFKELENSSPILFKNYKDLLINIACVSNHQQIYKYALSITDNKEKDVKIMMRIAVMNNNEELFHFSYDYFNGLYKDQQTKYEKAHNVLCNEIVTDAVTCRNIKVLEKIIPKMKKPLNDSVYNLEFAHGHKNFVILDLLLENFYKIAIKKGSR